MSTRHTPTAKPVHPHVCGELKESSIRYRRFNGSSPRLWGTLDRYILDQASGRFIPTSVGNSLTHDRVLGYNQVHPHVCGELCQPDEGSRSTSGSSPRLWGTRVHLISHRWKNRFIPTSVGNSIAITGCRSICAVHPHVCGELSIHGQTWGRQNGSSPRLWGTRDDRLSAVAKNRFIPTSVGNSRRRTFICVRDAVHPHVCGELPVCKLGQYGKPGSSPRLWGTRISRAWRFARTRFIPTSVGNS